MCVGCRVRVSKADLLRIVRAPSGPRADVRGAMPGRGAYVHRDQDCTELALRPGVLVRALRIGPGTDELGRLRIEIEEAFKHV